MKFIKTWIIYQRFDFIYNIVCIIMKDEKMNRIKIAVLDNGVYENCEIIDVKNQYYINEILECKRSLEKTNDNTFMHGTNCAMIINQICIECELFSIRILETNGLGSVEKLEPALNWCINNDIQIVNLSFGTTHFQDRTKIRKIINHYANSGMIIVAASSNDGYKTYPASFSNVIGAAVGDTLGTNAKLQIYNGIDFIAPSEHEIKICNHDVKLKRCNSYAAPYVTALLASMANNNQCLNLDQLRKELIKICDTKERFFYNPDWIEKACVSVRCMTSRAKFYFGITELNKKGLEQSDVDTIIIKDSHDLKEYQKTEKNIVYLGEEEIFPDKNISKARFWSKQVKLDEFASVEESIQEIKIPIIECRFEEHQDEMYWLSTFKEFFCQNGYNLYVVSDTIESILFDFDYVPKEMYSLQNCEKINSYFFWQTYYNQSDIMIMSSRIMKDRNHVTSKPDIIMDIYGKEDSLIKVECSKRIKINKKVSIKDNTAMRELYTEILQIMMEETDE